MEILTVKENLFREPPPTSVQKPPDRPEPTRDEVKAPSQETPEIDLRKNEEAIKALTENINSFMQNMRYSIQFLLDKANGQVVIKVLDGEGKLIRRIPPEAMVALSHRIGESIGMVINETLE